MVNDNRYVTMVIEPEVSRVTTSTFNSSFQDPSRRLARTSVMVASGGTAMIAGLISTEDTDQSRRIPGLGDIPLIGLPFKRTETEKKNTEILLFITPHIIDDETGIKKTFAKEREQSPLSTKEEQLLQGNRKRILKERGVVDTVDTLVW
jgi:type II secretory pathway component GspD/PulD (secretin)